MAGFYGLDLYNLGASIRAVIDFLDEADPEAAKVARERYGCLRPWAHDPAAYGRLAVTQGFAFCEVGAVQMLRDLMKRRMDCLGPECDEWLDAAANARLIKNAEAYYRVMYYGSAESWNLRDTHMFETLCQLLEAKGPEAKAVVWAHNSHIGNAAHTEMGQVREELNIGQLVKERFGARGAADRLRHPQRHRRRGDRLGRADGGEDGAAVAAGELRAAVPRQRRPALPPRPSRRRGRTRRWSRRCWSRGWSASSESSTGRRPSAGAIIPRRCCPTSSTPGSGSTRPRR